MSSSPSYSDPSLVLALRARSLFKTAPAVLVSQEPGALCVNLPQGCVNGRRPRGESESRL
jgi:hypothetical protein